MSTDEPDQVRLGLAELTCRLAHVQNETSALADRRAFPAMPDDRRAARLAELEAEGSALQRRRDELAEEVPDPERVRAPDGTLPAERRRLNLGEYRMWRRDRLRALEAKTDYLYTVLRDKRAPTDVRRRARDARATACNEIEALRAEPSDNDLRPQDVCPDGAHLASSHGYVWTSARPAWPCAAWPGQRLVFEEVARLCNDDTIRSGDHELTRWRLTLYCGHSVERTADSSYATFSAIAGGFGSCETCGVDPAFLVEEKSLGPVVPAPPTVSPTPAPPAVRKALERRAAKLETELAAIRAQLQGDK